ncbi:AsmA family protein [Falsiroseomonas selenitidurans]|uniref:AsmA family protein n=1 Tax=Falsiroseomonas selenitidurans TaxID=2716335 RepID=A0ABX1EBE6_9PROT|nr:AsmA family protein [Falsiroseomonas selenitidurans]NKC33083.1 AsmA family protein [Falsiroseomonas selenitidurans]
MKRLLTALLLLLVVIGAGLWFGPRFVDWEPWRGRLAELASLQLGRRVTLDGPVELALLPQPVVRAGGVAVGEPGEEYSFTARLLRVRLDLPALLGGRLSPREIALVGADLRLPWPPGGLLALRPPAWITRLDANLEDGTVRIGEAALEGVSARLSSGGPAQSLEVAGSFTWAGRATQFTASLGRPGWDGIATFEMAVVLPEVLGNVRGVLIPGTGFEGQMEASGPDLSAMLPSPAGAFRAAGRLSASAELIAADELAIEIAGSPARGAVALRLAPAPRLDIALVASRLDLDGWVAALRGAGPRPWPVSIDLSAEAGSFRGVTLRRLRGAAFLEEGRLTLSDVSLLLPGETELELAGATAGARLELGARFAGPDLRTTFAALGLPVAELDPTLLRQGEGRMRLVLEDAQAAMPEFAASFGALQISGAGVLRHGPRPALGLGLSVNELDLARWLPQGFDPVRAGRALGIVDLNLRLAAERVRLGEAVLERAALDGALEAGRLTLRRLSGRLAGIDLAVSGVLGVAPQLRLQDLNLEATGSSARGLAALFPGIWPGGTALADQAVALRLAGGGMMEALALRGSAELGELRLEANGTLDAPRRTGTLGLTLRHPGAPRLISEALQTEVGTWLGEGSLSLIATLALSPRRIAAESFELVAAALRARGALALNLEGRPRLSGRIAAEHLPLPFPGWRSREPLGLRALAGLDAELALEAARVTIGEVTLEEAATTLRLNEARLRLEALHARLAGGQLQATLTAEADPGLPPRLALAGRLTGATLGEPAFDLPVDIAAARGDLAFALEATGFSPAALLASLAGRLQLDLRDGVLAGFDLAGAASASTGADAVAAEAAIRAALLSGATAFERLEVEAALQSGRLLLETARMAAEGDTTATLSGSIDLPRATLDLQVLARPAVPDSPDLGLRLTGPAEEPRRLPQTSPWARWRARRG